MSLIVDWDALGELYKDGLPKSQLPWLLSSNFNSVKKIVKKKLGV